MGRSGVCVCAFLRHIKKKKVQILVRPPSVSRALRALLLKRSQKQSKRPKSTEERVGGGGGRGGGRGNEWWWWWRWVGVEWGGVGCRYSEAMSMASEAMPTNWHTIQPSDVPCFFVRLGETRKESTSDQATT